MDIEQEMDELYGGDRDDFTARRDALAKRLRKDGDRGAADRVKALRKPTVAAWAVDRLARDEAKDVQALLDSVDALRDAQEAALGGDAGSLRETSAEHRDIVQRLVAAAERALGEEGTATIDRVRETLQAASVDDDAREDLLRGRIAKEMPGGAFDPFSGMPDLPPRKATAKGSAGKRADKPGKKAPARPKPAAPERKPETKPAETSHRELRKARGDLATAEKRAAGAERRYERAQEAFAQAESKRDEAREALEDALTEREGLEATVRRLERSSD